MVINKKKSGIMYLRGRKRSEAQKTKFHEDNKKVLDIPVVMEYKYLGILFDETLKFDSHLE